MFCVFARILGAARDVIAELTFFPVFWRLTRGTQVDAGRLGSAHLEEMMSVWGLAGFQRQIMTYSRTADAIWVKRQRRCLLFELSTPSTWVTERL